jgi:hypothetical protein
MPKKKGDLVQPLYASSLKKDPFFSGFNDPEENFYRLPNSWFDTMRVVRKKFGSRIISPLKITEYVLKHTWGYRHFDGQVRLSANEIADGRLNKSRRLDKGVGLSQNSIHKASQALHKLGVLEVVQDTRDKARRLRTFRPRMREAAPDRPAPAPSRFAGFEQPKTNYFKVPNVWTDLMRRISSASTILCIEYFFRHAWGYQNEDGIWLDAEQVSRGRLKRDGTRYDKGVGYDVSTTYRSLEEGVTLGFLVWKDFHDGNYTKHLYNLRLTGMPVDANGQYHEGTQPHSSAEKDIRNVEEDIRNVEEDVCNVEEVICNVEEDVCNVEDRSATPHTLKDTSNRQSEETPLEATPPKIDARLCDVVVANDDEKFLKQLGIKNPSREKILALKLAPHLLVAHALETWLANVDNKQGMFIQQILGGDKPRDDFVMLAQLSLGEWAELLHKKDRWSSDAHTHRITRIWRRIYKNQADELLPDCIFDIVQSVEEPTPPVDVDADEIDSQADDELPALPPSEVNAEEIQLWQMALSDFLPKRPSPFVQRAFANAVLHKHNLPDNYVIVTTDAETQQYLAENFRAPFLRTIKRETGKVANAQILCVAELQNART